MSSANCKNFISSMLIVSYNLMSCNTPQISKIVMKHSKRLITSKDKTTKTASK